MRNYIIILALLFSSQSIASKPIVVNLNLDQTHQEIHSFGASDSWRVQFVGENWPEEKRAKIADLLFSLESDKNGNPKGIGLSNWRFYLGAGSMEQGHRSDIKNVWRRSECFVDAEGNYDWNKYKGQRWFLQEAKKQGVPHFTAYTISAPVFYTRSGLAHATKGDLGFNLQVDKYDDYAKYLVDVLEHFEKNEGVAFDFISPFNEPQWAWDKSNQEGTPATNKELFKYLKVLSKELSSRKIKTKMLVGEAGDLGYLYEKKGTNNNGDQINVFFNPNSEMYIGNLDNLEYAITSHSYFTTWPLNQQIEHRQKVAKRIKEINPKLDFHQTEFCILEKNPEIEGGWGRDLGMPLALYVARVIHSDLTIANARSWEWWTALTQFDFKDGLIHLDDGKSNGVRDDQSELNKQLMYDGEISETKLLWAMGNFSRFVRPGMVRVEATTNNNLSLLQQATDLQVSAYKDMESGKIVCVFINHSKKDKEVDLKGMKIKNKNAKLFVTDNKRDLEKVNVSGKYFTIPKRSVSTLILK